MNKNKFVYSFEEGKGLGKQLLGGKGSNMCDMVALGLPIPYGFTISTETCKIYCENNQKVPENIMKEIEEHLKELERKNGKKLGDPENPLLVSVRSGAAISMPGMMDTVLNLGLTDKSVEGLATKTNNKRFSYDCYRRLLQMFGNVVLGMDSELFEHVLTAKKKKFGVKLDNELSADNLKEVIEEYKLVYEKDGKTFPQCPITQLHMSINAVFGSWNNKRAISYRRINNITGLIGTAVNIQTMVYGNFGDTSGTGVCFSRNPSTGENKLYGEFLFNAQGEDVVAGIRTPIPVIELDKAIPELYKQLQGIVNTLENFYKDMQDMEFTIQEGVLFFLQTRTGKRTAKASVTIAVDMVKEGLIDKETGIMRVEPNKIPELLFKQIDPKDKKKHPVIAKGLPASPGGAVGQVALDAETAFNWVKEKKKVVLVRTETCPDDIEGMHCSEGILTSRGGMTSHAAVIARGFGTCCIVGCESLVIDLKTRTFTIGDKQWKEGDIISLDGSTGEVFDGKVAVCDPELGEDFLTLMKWSDEFRRLGVRTNADRKTDTLQALKFGAEGIGLVRTEHMFFEGDRIIAMREMIIAEDEKGRRAALDKLKPYQKKDFLEIFSSMDGKPVTVRLIDPPLHEFLPSEKKDIDKAAKEMNIDPINLEKKIHELHEANPMLGHRGCRLGITYPEITEMQVTALFEAAVETNALPEVMVPLVGKVEELLDQKKIIREIGLRIMGDKPFKVGTMIEVPVACLNADKIAKEADFFSFGTNDLTQMGMGFSRDDAGKFLNYYVEKHIYEKDPFLVLDQEGVGQLIQIAVEKGRRVNPKLKIGICGEHGGEPSSIEFCHKIGLDYVSCSPFRVPIARLAAAQAAIKEKQGKL